jgi:serine/threonine protein kinase
LKGFFLKDMSQTDNTDNSINPKKIPSFDKTFVEGSEQNIPVNQPSSSRIDATKFGSTNPYSKTSIRNGVSPTSLDELPSGNEPIPLGSGTIVGLLGAGGMAKVYKIWNEKLEVFRAVKILIPTQQGDLKNRFETEAKITAKLRHPNIVEIYNVGEWKNLPYLEMEFIDGVTLENIIARYGKLPPAVCSAISIFIARALSYAHNQDFLLYGKTYHGIIHRDLKPANIMISKKGDLRLMDFGIARPTEASLHTVEGNIVGTMQYLSPEQIDGVEVDARADIYAFGTILYEMLTGTKTFPQETITNLMKKKITNEYRKFEEFDFSIPMGLAKISQKCLQLDKNKRFSSASELLEKLEEFHKSLTSETPEEVLKSYIANPTSATTEHTSFIKKILKPKYVFSAAGSFLVILLIFIFIITGPKQSEQKSKIAKKTSAEVTTSVDKKIQDNKVTQQQTEEILQPLLENTTTKTVDNVNVSNGTKKSVTSSITKTETQAKNTDKLKTTSDQKKTVSSNELQIKSSQSAASTKQEQLNKKYPNKNPLEIASIALANSQYNDVITSLEKYPVAAGGNENAFFMLLEAYIMTDQLRKSRELIDQVKLNDAQLSYLYGLLFYKAGSYKKAVENFQAALIKPSKYRPLSEIRNDALYYSALCYTELYKEEPSEENKGMVLQAWRVVKNTYASDINHPRYQKAVIELANVK